MSRRGCLPLIRLPDKGSPPISLPQREPSFTTPEPRSSTWDCNSRALESIFSCRCFISVPTSTSGSLKDTQLYLCWHTGNVTLFVGAIPVVHVSYTTVCPVNRVQLQLVVNVSCVKEMWTFLPRILGWFFCGWGIYGAVGWFPANDKETTPGKSVRHATCPLIYVALISDIAGLPFLRAACTVFIGSYVNALSRETSAK